MDHNIEAVNQVLFDTLQKLQNKQIEIPTAKAIVETSAAIAKNASLQLQAFKLTKGQTAAPKTLIPGKVFLTKGSKDTHAQKTEYAKSLGYKDLPEALGDLGTCEFRRKFREEFEG